MYQVGDQYGQEAYPKGLSGKKKILKIRRAVREKIRKNTFFTRENFQFFKKSAKGNVVGIERKSPCVKPWTQRFRINFEQKNAGANEVRGAP